MNAAGTPVETVPVVELTETSAAVLPLTPAQVATLVAVPELVAVTPDRSGRWRAAGRQRVGTVRIGVGDGALELRLHPKIPVGHLLGLIGHAGGAPVWRRGLVQVAEAETLVAAVADAFAHLAEQALNGGVLHGYVHREEALTVVRGRVRTGAQLGRRLGMPVPLEVAFDDHTADIAENRILLGALERLRSVPGVTAGTAGLLRHLSARLVGVVPVRPGAPLPSWRATRLNERYVPALRLAELILAGSSLRQAGSPAVRIDGFVLDLAQVFERFLTARLRDLLTPYGVRCEAQQGSHRLDRDGRVRFRPDVTAHRRGRPVTVVDAKYQVLEGDPPAGHLFQLISYCTALGLEHGHLVYAAGRAPAGPYRITGSGITVTAHVLDLGLPPDRLDRRTRELAERIALTTPSG
ncbi:McrC family protein [Planomonospora sp. ID91781]|uniref:McrC family protein n=1 Tax=Planomonospora sp. ID91781 TaxID=2738135 RepID=UPI0018C37462|nr:hypothetical protein [Planomonospora sp. ID91781]